MNETEDKSKSKEKRLEEKEKIIAEAQRSYAVAEMKKAHKLIEDTEKSRKLPAIKSICQRIDVHMAFLAEKAVVFNKDPFGVQGLLRGSEACLGERSDCTTVELRFANSVGH